MNYGFNLAAAGVLSALYRQDVASNNLANVETPGFKMDQTATIPREAAREEDGLFDLPSNRMLERLGAGVLLAPTRSSFSQGPLQPTANPLDLAIRGDGFFMVQGKAGANGQGSAPTLLTRDGRFTLDSKGRLVTAAEGLAVLDSSRSPITLDPSAGPVTVDADGTIRQRGSSVARVGLVDFADRSRLKKEGGGTFSVPASVLSSAQPATGDVLQKMVEKSNVDAVQAMMQVTNASNDAQGATRLMSMYDEMLNRAINTLGRVT